MRAEARQQVFVAGRQPDERLPVTGRGETLRLVWGAVRTVNDPKLCALTYV